MKLIYYSNKILDTKCEPVTVFDDQLCKELDEMAVLMRDNAGLGLAANQVGLNKRMFIFKDNKNEIYEIINPKVVYMEGAVSISEGCLSFPTIFIAVIRSESIQISYQDRKGEEKSGYAAGIEARVILHELDHLDGINFLSKVNRQTRKAALSQLKKVLK